MMSRRVISIKYFWQICKYKNDELPLYRRDGTPTWTSVSDIGKVYNGKEFTVNEYLYVESLFVKAIQRFMSCSNSSTLAIKQLERPLGITAVKESLINRGFSLDESKEMLVCFETIDKRTKLSFSEVECITRLALREYIWTELESDTMYVRFNYDYYIDIGSTVECEQAVKKVQEMKLSINLWEDPFPYFF